MQIPAKFLSFLSADPVKVPEILNIPYITINNRENSQINFLSPDLKQTSPYLRAFIEILDQTYVG
uniref:Uncharacterized protein n=1 Tax=Gloeothece verrucosa (strain PCC 7822) TaxID=497965 RepID=E0UIS5_GLOV7|nr:hypothetical protein Cyan7822_1385 [Gloeothece verrucosa PCC 7822]